MNGSRHRTSWIAAAAALLALLTALACDESKQLTQGERRIVVGSLTPSVCPAVDGDTTINVQATVYGLDGSVAPGIDVTMTTSDGTFPNGTQVETIRTTQAGIANIVLTTRRPPDDEIVVTGALRDGKDDSVTISAPPNARVTLASGKDTFEIGDKITVLVPTSGLCQVRQALFEIAYDPAVVKFLTTAEGGILNDFDSGGAPTATDLFVVDGPGGALRINYARTSRPPTGVTSSGTLLGLQFEAVGPGEAQIYIRSVSFVPVDERPQTTVNQADTPDEMPITVNPPAPVAAR
ncbi:MAG: cohesin domain-containing protein [Acidobacteria bacterium]|nr:cohesin domain-containing protein [Acidobacteriota bacterium]